MHDVLGTHPPDDGRLRPARPVRAEILEEIGDLRDPAAAFAASGQEIEPERTFRLVSTTEQRGPGWVSVARGTPNAEGGPGGYFRVWIHDSPHPHTLEEVVAFMSDAPNLGDVELWAREYATSMSLWTEVDANNIAYRFLRRDEPIPRLPGDHRERLVIEACLDAYDLAGDTWNAKWRDAEAKQLVVPHTLEHVYPPYGTKAGPPIVPVSVRGRPFAKLLNPFRQLDAIAKSGYAIEAVMDGVITILVAAPDP